jgi:hypothetical protein
MRKHTEPRHIPPNAPGSSAWGRSSAPAGQPPLAGWMWGSPWPRAANQRAFRTATAVRSVVTADSPKWW